MKKNEQDILHVIDEKTEEVIVPESLKPEQIEQVLLAKNGNGKKKKGRKKIYQAAGLMAACAVLAVGLWTYGDMKKENGEKEDNRTSQITDSHTIASAKSYDEVYSYIEAQREEDNSEEIILYDMEGAEYGITEESAVEDSASGSNLTSAKSSDFAGTYSETNVRQEGVDEGDVVKTDGRYLYILNKDGQKVSIVDTQGNMKEVGSIELGSNYSIQEIYLIPQEKKLILTGNVYSDGEEDELYARDGWFAAMGQTEVLTYDISDLSAPKEAGRVTQSGNYHSSRLVDGYVYLFSEYYIGEDTRKNDPETYIHLVNDNMIKETDIYMPMLKGGRAYEIITAIDVEQPDTVSDSKAIFTKGGQIYVSNHNIYYYEEEWQIMNETYDTTVRKISYANGQLKAEAQGTFDGYINDSFSIDEYEGYLRVVTTCENTNSVYVLDEHLEIVGKIENLAEDERVYSARFMGETGYFVTFRETDPLFSVDLSDPKNPRIIGKLKIPGFSEYLHFYGEDKLLGIGMNVDEETQITDGVKLTMFDISDKTDVKEAAIYVLEDVYSADVLYDYKAVLIDTEKNIIGFAAYPSGSEKYYIFSYENGEFVCKMEEEINGNGNSTARGVYIDDTLYVIQGNIIEAYSLVDYKKVDDLIL